MLIVVRCRRCCERL